LMIWGHALNVTANGSVLSMEARTFGITVGQGATSELQIRQEL
jgi:hypothetical protein